MDSSFELRVLDDELSHASNKERGGINDQLLLNILELAVIEEIRTALACDRSWNREPTKASKLLHVAFRKDFIKFYAKQLSLLELIKSAGLGQMLQAFKQDSPWPSGKRDEAWLNAAAASRDNLNKFWSRSRIGLKEPTAA